MIAKPITANDLLVCDSVTAVLRSAYGLMVDVIRCERGVKPWIDQTPALTVEPTWSTYEPDLEAGRIPGAVRLNAWLDPDQTWQFIPPPNDPHLTDARGMVRTRWADDALAPGWGLRLRMFGEPARYRWRGEGIGQAYLISAELRLSAHQNSSTSSRRRAA